MPDPTPEQVAAASAAAATAAANEAAEAKGGPGSGAGGEDKPLMFDGRLMTQEDLNEILKRERGHGDRKTAKSVVAEWGFDDLDAAAAYIKAQKEAEAAAMSEADRKVKEAADDRAKSEKERREAKAEKRTARLERALVRRRVNDDDLDDAMALLDKPGLDHEDLDAIAEAADKLKERRKELFDGNVEEETTPRTAGAIPKGKVGDKGNPPAKPFGAAGLKEAQRRGHVKT